MAKSFATTRFDLGLATWAEEAANPNAGAGTPAAVGSWWQQQGAYPAVPTTLQLKVGAGDKGWLKQNLVNLNVFNVKDPAYGAVGNGVTDDTAAINAAVAACSAAGGGVVYFPPVDVNNGQFYRLTKNVIPPNETAFVSVLLDDAHNITFMGDGFASTIGGFDDSGATDWHLFEIRNGSSFIRFSNLRIVGTAMVGQIFGALVLVNGQATDAKAGSHHISINGSWLGPTLKRVVTAIGNDDAHRLKNLLFDNNIINGSTSNGVVAFFITNFFDDAIADNNYAIGGAPLGNHSMMAMVPSGIALPADIKSCSATGNQFTRADVSGLASVAGLSLGGRSKIFWNILTVSEATIAGNTNVNVDIRGNIVVPTSSIQGPMIGFGMQTACVLMVRGNVTVSPRTDNVSAQGVSANGITTASGLECAVEVSDNVCQLGSTTTGVTPINCGLIGDARVSVAGNIAIVTSVLANNGVAVVLAAANSSSGCLAIGNLVVMEGTAIGNLSQAIQHSSSGGNGRSANISSNLLGTARVGVAFSGAFNGDWRAVANNNHVPNASETSFIIQPPSNIGVTHEGPAGPGAQIALVNTTPLGNVSAPTGSLCANTAGGQATTLSYKESGAGVSGGTAGWLGIGAFILTFGAKSLTTTTTALFLAPGGQGLVSAVATEIQMAVPRAGTVRNMKGHSTLATGGGNNVFTVRKNGVDTALTITIVNTSGNNVNDLVHTFTVVAGDKISVSVTKNGVITTAQTNNVTNIEIV